MPLFSDVFQTNLSPERLAEDAYIVLYMPLSLAHHFGNKLVSNKLENRRTGKPPDLR